MRGRRSVEPARRAKPLGDATARLEQARARVDETRAQIAERTVAIEQLEATKVGAADDPRAFTRIAEQRRAHETELERLAIVLAQREQAVIEAERDLRDERFKRAVKTRDAKYDAAYKAARQFASESAELVDRGRALSQARLDADEADALAHELRVDGVELGLPASADEPDWPDGIDELVELLTGGSRQPLATSAERARRYREQASRTREQEIREKALQLANTPREHVEELLGRFDPETRAEIERRAAKLIEDHRQRQAELRAARA